ncbi:hypothetical protein Pmar_PMAR013586 [Perkinsus marinus ATCC 50983]|uniref:CCHC-type domain-containing protein n=1 Tax=Perkinsus marinus (strain ATCC 50983 / TXsc) TaxID=423536 RepID=C5KR40_PERM5|nr:hypothetical protein Pmar_PMAR013586 [Perkinsus marinus ATCC 50983]EER13050.1 hypothetical protein Pmar_PMAR013586 [Perkinsus marinus ATCC 50983]|eukprot:XP_002781255.1 hypothetical protein Pmar_PMAR013586 [Perkinsus marinus ATCC 50983]
MEATVDTALDGMTKVYCTLIEENRRLSMKLLEAKEKQPLAAAPKTYLEAVASHIQRYPLSVQTKKPPAQLHQKRVTVRIDDLPESKQERETKLTQCRDKVVDRIGQDKLKVNKVRIREGDLVISVNESESPEEVRRSIGEIHGVSARVSRSLDPEVVVFTKALPMRVAEEELISQIKSYHPSLDTTAWHVVRAHRSFVILRMSLADRNKCMGPMKGSVFVRGCRLPARDYVGVSVCYDCGQVHAPNRKGEPVKRCRKKEDGSYSLQCIHCGQHGHCRNSCPKKDQNIEVNALKCTLCDKTGHSAHRGDLCPQKIAALKARLRKTDYGEGEAFVPFNWAFNLGEIGIDQ